MELLFGLNVVLAGCGYLLPLPCLVMAWIAWAKTRQVEQPASWRGVVSQVALLFLTVGVGLWIYAIVRDAWLHDYSYIVPSAHVGRWGSLLLLFVSAFASGKSRVPLLLGAVGLLFFFGSSIGDVFI